MNAHVKPTGVQNAVFNLNNHQLDRLDKLKVLVETISDKLSDMVMCDGVPSKENLQSTATLNHLAIDLIEQAIAGADDVFKLTVKP